MGAALGRDEDAFLRAHSRTFLLGLRADGSPTGWPMVCLYPGDALEFSTYGRSQKVRDFERNDNACCVVAPVTSDRALVLRGTAAVRRDQHEPPWNRALPPDVGVGGEVRRRAEERLRSGKRVVLRFTPHEARFVPGWMADAAHEDAPA
jgi:hypothetical protein